MADTSDTTVNVAPTQTVNNKIVELVSPSSVFTGLSIKAGVQTTPQLGRGHVTGSFVEFMNGNLAHACDVRFIFNLNFGSLGIDNPVTAIQNAIRNAKFKAAQRMKDLLADAVDAIRLIVDGVLSVLGSDPIGFTSFSWSYAKDLFRQINTTIKFIAEKTEIVLEWVFFAQQISQLVAWIESLPDKIKSLLAQCVANFTNSIKQIANNIGSIPAQITALTQAQLNQVVGSFTAAAQLTQSTLTDSLKTTTSALPAGLADTITTDTTSDHANTLLTYINSITPNANTLLANSTATLMSNSSSP